MTNDTDAANYALIAAGAPGFIVRERGLIKVGGREAVQFLNGLVTNDVAALADGADMAAAFPNAQGRLVALVRIRRSGDDFLFDTDGATHEKVFQNLFRFTYAGEFTVEDVSGAALVATEPTLEIEGGVAFAGDIGRVVHIPAETTAAIRAMLTEAGAVEMSPELYELFRIERGVPAYGVDFDESTIVPEVAVDGLISYTKGCYIGQEIIARIHFRGHVAKQLRRLSFEGDIAAGDDLSAPDGKPAGRVTSVADSPRLGRIGIGFVRYDYLADGTELTCGGVKTTVVGA